MSSDFRSLGATEVAEVVRTREMSALEVVDRSLQSIAEWEPALNACTVVLAEQAQAAAVEADRAVARGEELGPLHGVPVAIKDHIWVSGTASTTGSRALADFVAQEDAVTVARLRDAGAIVVAKTTNPEYMWAAYTRSVLHGVTRNPWNTERTSGGSSGGSASAVASGMVPLALGSDGGGSIRIPASFCGLVGHKPTRGVVPRGPGGNLYRTTGVIGPLARSVRDAVTCLSTIAGPHPVDIGAAPVPLGLKAASSGRAPQGRVAWSLDLGYVEVSSGVRTAFMAALEQLDGLGWKLEEARPATGDPEPFATPIYYGEMGRPPEGREHLLEPTTASYFETARELSAIDYHNGQGARAAYSRVWEEFLTEYELLLTPTVAIPPFAADPQGPIVVDSRHIDPDADLWFGLSLPANLTGQPSTTVPLGTDDGMPFGVQLTARRFQDGVCLAAAASIEAAVPWPKLAQPISTMPETE
jgi:Asp-tRNA(Asn)/Glu-tRNA(Gln) amidotransferase A subunit family amidase